MIICRTPLRVSVFGGGTDLRSYYSEQPGRVISTGIDKYLYVVLREQVGFVEHRYRINWSQVEFCREIDEIQHPIVREAFRNVRHGGVVSVLAILIVALTTILFGVLYLVRAAVHFELARMEDRPAVVVFPAVAYTHLTLPPSGLVEISGGVAVF